MRQALIVVVGLLSILTNARAQQAARGNPDVSLSGQSVDAMIAEFMKEHEVPGMALAIVQAPYITRVTGFGVADRERRTLVSSNSMFNIAQMKNAFTAVAVMQLVEAGKLQLDDSLRQRLLNPSGYGELEKAIEKASGRTYQEFVRKGQLEPLGLKHTFFASELPSVARETFEAGERHRRFLREPILIDPTEPARGSSSTSDSRSAIYSSAADISFWDIGLAGDILIRTPALRKVIYEPSAGASSTGAWFFPGHPGLMIATGSNEGFSSLLSRFTKSDELVCVTLLANKEGLDLTQLARRIAGAHNFKIAPPARAGGMRVQQSPYPLAETIARLERVMSARKLVVDVPLQSAAWEENGEVWVAIPDPAEAAKRNAIDSALLETVSAP